MIDGNSILEKCYDLLCTFFANKEIARRSNPNGAYTLTELEHRFFETKVSRLLIEIAVYIRVYDDQMRKIPATEPEKIKYTAIKTIVDKSSFGLFDDLNLTLRETCNKIIHSDVLQPHTQDGYGAHNMDLAYSQGEGEKTINWKHLNGYVRLAGKQNNQEWYVLLDIEVFISAIFQLFSELSVKPN